MLRTNYWTGVVVIIASALAVWLTARLTTDSRSHSSTRAAAEEPTVGADGLPEVVITAQRRVRPEPVALSARDVDAAASTSPIRVQHR
jgi:hypothetical protein